MSMDIYAEELLSHYEHPHNKGEIATAEAKMHEHNNTCGDDITVYLKIDGDKVDDVKFDGDGCSISIGTTSMLTDYIKGKSISDIEKMDFTTIKNLINIDPGPAGLKCATISLKAVKEAIFNYEKKEVDDSTKDL